MQHTNLHYFKELFDPALLSTSFCLQTLTHFRRRTASKMPLVPWKCELKSIPYCHPSLSVNSGSFSTCQISSHSQSRPGNLNYSFGKLIMPFWSLQCDRSIHTFSRVNITYLQAASCLSMWTSISGCSHMWHIPSSLEVIVPPPSCLLPSVDLSLPIDYWHSLWSHRASRTSLLHLVHIRHFWFADRCLKRGRLRQFQNTQFE